MNAAACGVSRPRRQAVSYAVMSVSVSTRIWGSEESSET